MQKIHSALSEKYSGYNTWHQNPLHQIIHWLSFIAITLVLAFYSVGSIQAMSEQSSDTAQQVVLEKTPTTKGNKVGEASDHILVKFKANIGQTKRAEIMLKHNLKEKSEIKQIGVKILSISDTNTPDEVVDRLRAQNGKDIEFAEVDAMLAPSFIPNDPAFTYYSYNKKQVNAPVAWDYATGSPDLIVGIVDTGVYCAHEDFKDLTGGRCLSGVNIYSGGTDTTDVYGHGTQSTGVAMATGNNGIGMTGFVWPSKILPIKVAASDGSATYSNIASGIAYAADHGSRVVNVSYGAGGSATVQNAGQYLISKNGLLVVSAGNEGINSGYGENSNVIVVSSVDSSDVRYSWSNFGNEVDVSAPGCSSYTTANSGGYTTFCGTSNSAPEVSGILALIFSANPTLTPIQAQNILFSTVKDLGTSSYDMYYGWGRVDAGAAVTLACTYPGAVCNSVTPPPPPPPPTDTEAPTIPTNVSASAPDSTKVNLSWTASTDNVGVTGYKIFRNNIQVSTTSSLLYTDTSVIAGNTYTYQVSAYDVANNVSALSSGSTITVPLPPPPSVTNVSITSYQVSQKTTNSATITWTTNIPSTGTISYGTNKNSLTSSVPDITNTTSHSITINGLTKFTTYYYKISAVSSENGTTVTSPVSSFKTARK